MTQSIYGNHPNLWRITMLVSGQHWPFELMSRTQTHANWTPATYVHPLIPFLWESYRFSCIGNTTLLRINDERTLENRIGIIHLNRWETQSKVSGMYRSLFINDLPTPKLEFPMFNGGENEGMAWQVREVFEVVPNKYPSKSERSSQRRHGLEWVLERRFW